MADGVELNAGTGGATIKTDDDGAQQHAVSKIELGLDGSFDGYVATTNPLPIRFSSGTAFADPYHAEDAAHVSGHYGAMALGVRKDSIGSLVDTDGDYAPLQINAKGYLRVAPSDFFFEVAKGNVPNHTSKAIMGYNPDVDTGTAEELWPRGTAKTWLGTSSGEKMRAISDNANDHGSGTGARTITIEGLSNTGQEQSENITLLSGVATLTTNTYLRVNNAFVTTAGSNGSNVGTISVYPQLTGAGAPQAEIYPGLGEALHSHYTVPVNRTAYFVGGSLTVSNANSDAGCRVRMFVRIPNGGPWRLRKIFTVRPEGSSVAMLRMLSPFPITAVSDIKWDCTAQKNDSIVFLEYNLILVS
jgi:hypothetical protein